MLRIKEGEGGLDGYKKIIIGIFTGILLSLLVAEDLKASELGEPGKFVMRYVEKGLSVLNDPVLKNNANERRAKLWDEVSPAFNFHEMCKRTLSRAWWAKISEKQRGEFITSLTVVVKEAFLGRLDFFSGEEVDYLREIQDDRRAKVQCEVILQTDKKITVDYSLLFGNGNWVIYDVAIEGVSVANNYRKQFDNFLNGASFDELLRKLKEMS